MNKEHMLNMDYAVAEAEKSIMNESGGPFGCCIVDRYGNIIGLGHNQVVELNDPTCHGEIQAIRDACKRLQTFDLSGCTLYTTSYPCPMCMGAIMWARISRVFYGCSIEDAQSIGFDDKEFYEKFNDIKNNMELIQINQNTCLNVFKYYVNSNHTLY